MAICILILGETGSGKSTSLRNLKPDETYIANVMGKPLPFRGAKKNYTSDTNFFHPKKGYDSVRSIINKANTTKKIKNVVIDDSQYLLAGNFMDITQMNLTGNAVFKEYNDLANRFWTLLKLAQACRDDLTITFLHHMEEFEGKFKAKTVGKILDEKITIEGVFTYVLHAYEKEGKYKFRTNGKGAKTPWEMFDGDIDNDLQNVIDTINAYNEGE